MKTTKLDLSAELLWQDPEESSTHLYRVLKRHLSSRDIVGCRVVAAYASWGGLSLVSSALEAFLQRGKRLQTVFGTGNTITTPDALLYALYLNTKYPKHQSARTFEWRFGNSEFHPKYYEFQYPDRLVTLIGSSNLTNGGLAMNHELSVAVTAAANTATWRACDAGWNRLWKRSEVITSEQIRALRNANALGAERARARVGDKPLFLGVNLPRAKKPLFRHLIEDEPVPKVRHEVLAAADSLSEKPARLFLQILEHETGGGHQIQLPVATLGAFFGVGKDESKDVKFRFPSIDEDVNVQLTHFENHTYRVRLLPLKEVPRPAIVVFEQGAEPGTYDCRVVSPAQYPRTLRDRCTEQTREGSRRWGLQQ
jgi:HKD family nuclease